MSKSKIFLSLCSSLNSQFSGYQSSLPIIIVLLGLALVFYSCNKDEQQEDPPPELDAETVYNLDLQEQYATAFDALLNTMDTLEVADSILQLFLADPNIISGSVFEQAIFVNYANGTSGGIFFDPQDEPEANTSAPPQTIPIGGTKSVNITPTNKGSIFINPHYFEREAFANSILETYDNLLPGVGYATPERYLNEDCTLDVFTNLEGYGFIHIYSHGVKIEDLVYLKTGESPNASSHTTYKDYLDDGVIVCLTSVKHKTTKYYILPQFIYDYNNFSNSKPLVYGGYCFGVLGDWPEMFEALGALGYFSFDWAVRTHRSANWAKNLVTYMTDYTVADPYSALWWITSSPIEKTYWADNHNRNVTIHYKGEDDLVLWNWDATGSVYKSAYISLLVNGTFENSDGEVSNEVWEISPGIFIGHEFSFAGNSYQSSWEDEIFFDRTRTGNISMSVRPDGKELTYINFNDTVFVSPNSTKYTYNISFSHLPLISEDDESAIFEITGNTACSAINQLEYRTDYITGSSLGWEVLTSYNCIPADAKISVVVHK